MKRMKGTTPAFVIVLMTGVMTRLAFAQQGQPLTLEDAIKRGLDASHRLAESVARSDAARAVVDERRANGLPQVAAQAGYTRTNHVDVFGILLPGNQLRVIYPDVPDNYRSRLDLQWPVYTGGRVDALERAARAEAGASSDDVETMRSDLRLEITRAFWALVTARESQRVVNESLQRVGVHLQDVRNQLAVGLVPPNDVLSLEAQESRQRMLSIQATSARDVAEAALARLIGAPATAIEPVVAFDAPAAPAPLPALVEDARRQRPERAALVKRVAAAEARQTAAAAGTKPTLAVVGGVDYARPNPRIFPRAEAWRSSWDAGVNAVWPLFDGGRSRAEFAEAAAGSRAVRERLAEFESVLAVEVRQRVNELTASQAAVRAADEAVRSAAEARRVTAERFAAGVIASVDVLDAQVALLQAELDRTQAVAIARLAEAQLARAIGR